MLRIDELLERRPGEISAAARSSAPALARTLVANPEVYLLDEPISHLDARIRHELRQQFHNLEEAPPGGDPLRHPRLCRGVVDRGIGSG